MDNSSQDWKVLAKVLTAVLIVGMSVPRLMRPAAAAESQQVDFTKDIAPIFKANCIKCHGLDTNKPKKKPAAELRLDDEVGAMKGGRSGKAIIPGDAKDSLLYKLLHGPVPRPVKGEEDKDIDPMPKVKRGEKWKPLPKEQIKLIGEWIDQGAHWSK